VLFLSIIKQNALHVSDKSDALRAVGPRCGFIRSEELPPLCWLS